MSVIALDDIRVASPCSASWDEMVGNSQVRFCGGCRQNVYNLSEMSRTEAQQFVDASEGRKCVRFYRRTDGTLLTKDCSCGRQDAHRQMARLGTRFAMLFGLMAGAAALPQVLSPSTGASAVAAATPPPVETPRLRAHMGDYAPPPPPIEPSVPETGELVAPPPSPAPAPAFMGKMAMPTPAIR